MSKTSFYVDMDASSYPWVFLWFGLKKSQRIAVS
jgi:hypothetical protein